jgi:lactoylglutathione lyase
MSPEEVMRMSVAIACAALLLLTGLAGAASAQTETLLYDHVHMAVPNPQQAAEWYQKNVGGEFVDDLKDRLLFGTTRIMFIRGESAQPSEGSVIDHIGFSYADIDAKVRQLEAAGARITTPVRDLPGVFKLGFVVDPWGTKLEIVQDAELAGFHHVHLRAPDPDTAFKWYLDKFGGQRQQFKGRFDSIKYPGNVWLLIQKGETRPSRGSAIDHIGWRAITLDAKINELRSKGVTVETEPRPLKLPNGTIQFAYVAGPDGARVELVEREKHMK